MANEAARHLRKTMTPHEVKLWSRLRRMRSEGHHFRRQSPIGRYIVDFECRKSKLVLELDGSQHGSDGGLAMDMQRDRFLSEAGYTILRFWNNDIDRNLDGVLELILHRLESRRG